MRVGRGWSVKYVVTFFLFNSYPSLFLFRLFGGF